MSENNLTLDPKSGEINKKQTFGNVQKQKKGNARKKVATAVVATAMVLTAIAVPTVIKLNQNKGYTVTIQYNMHGQIMGENTSISLKKGSVVGDIQVPAKPGYVFVEYCSDVECTQNLAATTVITEDLTVYLHYVAITYNVNLSEESQIYSKYISASVNNGEEQSISNIKLNYGDELKVRYGVSKQYNLITNIDSQPGLEKVGETEIETDDNYTWNIVKYKVVGFGLSDEKESNIELNFILANKTFNLTFVSDGETHLSTNVVYGSMADVYGLTNPTKDSTDSHNYTFVGWSMDENADPDDEFALVDLSSTFIEADTTYYAIYRESLREYNLNIDVEDGISPDCVVLLMNKGGTWTDVGHPSSFAYGNEIVIKYAPQIGYEITKSDIVSGLELTNKTVNINGETYSIYKVVGNVSIAYSQELENYKITIPAGVTVKRGDETITENSNLHYNDELTITYAEDLGYELDVFTVLGANQENGIYKVIGNVGITYTQKLKEYTITATGNGGTLTLTDENGNTYTTGDKVKHFTRLTVEYTPSTGHHQTELKVNGKDINNGAVVEITDETNITYTEEINTYTVTFYDENRTTVLFSTTIDYDGTVTYTGVPTKASNLTYTYKFNAWQNAEGGTAVFTNIKADTAYYATYTASYIEYAVGEIPVGVDVYYISGTSTQYSGETKLTETSNVHYGDLVRFVYNSTEGHHYLSFNVTNLKITNEEVNRKSATLTGTIGGEITINCVEEIDTVTVTFVNYDGTSLGSKSVDWGTSASLSTPTRPSTDMYNYTFAGWVTEDGEPANLNQVTQDLTVQATYTENYQEYTLSLTGNMTATYLSGTSNYTENAVLTNGATLHFNDEIKITYHADEGHHITGLTLNGLTQSGAVETTSTNASGQMTAGYVITTMAKNATVTFAQELDKFVIEELPSQVTITYVSGFSSYDVNTQLHAGDEILFGDIVRLNYIATEHYHMTDFNAFGNTIENGATVKITNNLTVGYTESIDTYTISLVVGQADYGSISGTNIADVPYGSTISVIGNKVTVNGQTITATAKTATAQYTYSFAGWSVSDGETITGAKSITANFTRTVNNYTVTLASSNTGYGTVNTTSISVPYGSTVSVSGNAITVNGQTITATAKTATTQYAYSFTGWSVSSGTTITSSTTITANFTRNTNFYTISIGRNNTGYGTVSSASVSVPYGVSITTSGSTVTFSGSYLVNDASKTFSTSVTATATTTTAQYSYAFSSWTSATGTVTGAKTITANFTRSTRSYTVSFSTNNSSYGRVNYSSLSVPYGSSISVSGNTITINGTTITATAASTTSNYSYSFSSWSNTSGTITSARTITANFTRNDISMYTVTMPTSSALKVTDSSNNVLTNGSKIQAGKTIVVQYTSTSGYAMDTFSVSGIRMSSSSGTSSGSTSGSIIGTVTGNVVITYTEVSVGSSGEEATEGLSYESVDGGYAVSGYTGTSSIVNIPATYQSQPVVKVYSGAFRNNSTITTVNIGKNVTAFSPFAFMSCKNLTSISLPSGLKSIGTQAFYGCSSLTSMTLPNTIEIIDMSAFSGCLGLTSVTINSGVLETNAFKGCTNLTNITFGNGVTSIGDYAFAECVSLKTLVISSSVTSLGLASFSGCTGLTRVYIPASVTTIKNSNGFPLFRLCSNDLTLYCGATSQPSGWDSRWNYNESVRLTVNWGWTESQFNAII